MGRPPKRPVVDGVELVEHLYQDPKKREGKFLYVRPDTGKKRILKDKLTPRQANKIAAACNAKIAAGDLDGLAPRDPKAPPAKGSWGDLVERYIARKERLEPDQVDKKNWQNLRSYMRKFGREFAHIAPHKITRKHIVEWWDELSHHQQGKRHPELRKLFNWAMGEGFCPQLQYNPFTTNDDRPRLYIKPKPEKLRSALSLEEFWAIYDRAGDKGFVGLQRAMLISLCTTMREGDICKLRFSNIVDGELRVVIGKSEAQRGAGSAARLSWCLETFPLLRDVINDAREGSLAARRCPFIVYHRPLRQGDYRDGAAKEHQFQMLPNLIQQHFRKVQPKKENPPTFHEVRALSSVLYRHAGYDIELIQELMAHTEESTTRSYQDYGDLPFKPVSISLTAGDIGRTI